MSLLVPNWNVFSLRPISPKKLRKLIIILLLFGNGFFIQIPYYNVTLMRVFSAVLLNKKIQNPSPTKEESKSLFSNIKEELALITLVILATGLIFVDAYYQTYGLRVDSFSGNSLMLVYKGLLMTINYPIIFLPYAITIAIPSIDIYLAKTKWWLKFKRPIAYTILFFILYFAYCLATNLGVRRGRQDMVLNTTHLSKIQVLETKSDTTQAPEQILLLLATDNDFIYVFEPTPNLENQIPVIQRISKGEVLSVKTKL